MQVMKAGSGESTRLLGLDYGSRTVGVAVTDELGMLAHPVETIVRAREDKLRQTLARIAELADEYDIARIVVGLPTHMDASEGERAEKARQFGALVEKRTGRQVVYQDERLTTAEADEILEECGIPRSRRKSVIDQAAACIILRDYMNMH